MNKLTLFTLVALFGALTSANAETLETSLRKEVTAQKAEQKLMPWEQDAISPKAQVRVSINFFPEKRFGAQQPDYSVCNGLILTPNGWLLLSKQCLPGINNQGRFISLDFNFARSSGRHAQSIFYSDKSVTRASFKVEGDYALYKMKEYVHVPNPYMRRPNRAAEMQSTAQIIRNKMYLQKIFTNNDFINDDFKQLFGQYPDEALKAFVKKTIGEARFNALSDEPKPDEAPASETDEAVKASLGYTTPKVGETSL